MSKKKTTQTANKQAKPSQNTPLLLGLLLVALVAITVIIVAIATRQNTTADPTPAIAGAPRLDVNQTEIDHGAQRFSTQVESVFTVRNTGDQPLQILGEPRVELVEGC